MLNETFSVFLVENIWDIFGDFQKSVISFRGPKGKGVMKVSDYIITYLMIWQDACMLKSMYITLNFSFQVRHTPTKVDEKESNTEKNFNEGARQIGPVAHIWKSETLHDFMQILHIFSGQGIHIFSTKWVFNQQFVKLLDFISRSKCPGKFSRKYTLAWNCFAPITLCKVPNIPKIRKIP